ncbi:MAG: N-acetylmuramoyl-L-alanine amidase [Lachnospiraceae bacterium]|nr:N-acetylmuramoyl-L-alanine amidase [Lachnospiraceae bacterium]
MKKCEGVLTFLITVLLLSVLFTIGRGEAERVSSTSASVAVGGYGSGKEEKKKVVLDAGHGGADPGKIGINGALEKDVNLQITLLVKRYLEAQDVEVILTRESEEGLYDADASNKKVQDMKRRIEKIEEAAPAIAVSIHQNSYPEEYVKGAQVFYYTNSVEGQKLAQLVQDSLVQRVEPDNRRQIKPNDSYYMLKKASVPIVIVECGFLSNSDEAEKLCDPEYQERVAWAIHMGILQYLNHVRTFPF